MYKRQVNKNMVPFDTESPFVTSGIRIGSPAMTTRGFGEAEFKQVAMLVDKVIQNPGDESVHNSVAKEVEALCENFPLYDFATV